MRRQLLAAIRMLVILTIVLGVIYPLAVTGIFIRRNMSNRANGSLVSSDGSVVGSELLAQAFGGEPSGSSLGHGSYDPTASGASNLGPNNPDLDRYGHERRRRGAPAKRRGGGHADPGGARVHATSGSNLDPDVFAAYAKLQAPRVATARGLAVRTSSTSSIGRRSGGPSVSSATPGSTYCSSISRWNA